jgi:energy-coupling factor transporter transmembrane protein EcfT
MEKAGGTAGIFVIFKFIPFITYLAIALIIAMIAIWVVFGIKKYRWAKILAITSTVLAVITSLLLLSSYLVGSMSGKKIPLSYYFEIKGRAAEKEKFRDYRDREKDKGDNKEKEIEEKKSEKKSRLDIDTREPSVDFANEVVAI